MNKKKKQFDRLKNKLKNLYFKKILSIVNNKSKLNLEVEKNNPISEIVQNETNPIKIETVNLIKEQSKPNIVVNKIFNKLPDVVHQFGNTLTNYKNQKLSLISDKLPYLKNNFLNKIIFTQLKGKDKSQNINIVNGSKYSNTINFNTVEKENINQPKIIKNTDNKFINSLEKINEIKNKVYKFYDKVKLKYVEKPSDIKNISIVNNIQPNNEIDFKTHFIPSKEQIKVIKDKLLTKSKEKIIQNTKFITNSKVISKIFNKEIINNPNKVEKQNTVYVLPAFQDGSESPLQSDVIGKIHKNELVLNEKETRRLVGDRSGILPNEVQNNLTPNLPPKENSQEVQDVNIKSSDFIKNDSYEDSVIKPELKIEPSNMLTDTVPEIPMNKNRLQIKRSLRNTLKSDIVQKNRMIPEWRSSYG